MLGERGFDAHPLSGGFDAWRDAGMTLEAKRQPVGAGRG
jgi:hypothetical protein